MTTTDTTLPPGPELDSERIAGGILPKVLNTFDMVAIFIAVVLFITNAAGFYGNKMTEPTDPPARVKDAEDAAPSQ